MTLSKKELETLRARLSQGKRRITDTTKDDALRDYIGGMSLAAAAKKHGISTGTLYLWRNKVIK